jgi:hypothetical protein
MVADQKTKNCSSLRQIGMTGIGWDETGGRSFASLRISPAGSRFAHARKSAQDDWDRVRWMAGEGIHRVIGKSGDRVIRKFESPTVFQTQFLLILLDHFLHPAALLSHLFQ